MPRARFRRPVPVSGQARADVRQGHWLQQDGSVGLALAPSAGASGLLDGSGVDRLTEVHLPRLGPTPDGVPRVEPDEVVADEGDGEQHAGGDQSCLSEEATVDAEALVALGADDPLDEGSPVERQRPARGLSGVVLPVPF